MEPCPRGGYTGHMFKNLTVAWTVAVIAVVVAIAGLTAARTADRRAQRAESLLRAAEQLRNVASENETARFVSVDPNTRTLTYEIPHQVEMNGQTYVNYIPQTASYNPEVLLVRSTVPELDAFRLHELKAGQDISIHTYTAENGQLSIDELYIP